VFQFEIPVNHHCGRSSRKGAKAQRRRGTVVESLVILMLPLRLCASSVNCLSLPFDLKLNHCQISLSLLPFAALGYNARGQT
jgi:hypothetical protein